MYRTLLGCLILMLGHTHLLGQDPYFFNFDTEHGLPSSEVYSVGFDEHGMPWFATDRGVCRYNGYEFTTFSTLDGLANNTCLDIHTSPDGKLWFLGLDGSISYLEDGAIKPFQGNEQIFEMVGHPLLSGCEWEPDGKMYLWCFVGAPTTVLSYDPATETLSELSLEDDFFKDRKSRVGQLDFYAVGKSQIPTRRVPNILVTDDGTIFHDRNYETGILYVGNLHDPEVLTQLDLGVKIHSFYLDDSGDLLVSTSNGLFRFPNADITQEPDVWFREVSFSSAVKDAEGNYWLTSLEEGIFLVPSFEFHGLDIPDGDSKSTTISSLVAMEDHLFFGSMEGGIYAVDKELNTDLLFASNIMIGLLNHGVRNESGAYISTYALSESDGEAKVTRIDPNTRYPVAVKLDNGDLFLGNVRGYMVVEEGELNKDYLPVLPLRIHTCREVGNRLYIGTLKGLWYIENYNYTEPKPIKVGPNGDQLRINDLETDEHDNLWVVSIGEGLTYLADGLQHPVGMAEGLSSNMVNKVTMGGSGILYAATNVGLNRVEYEWNGSFRLKGIKQINVEDGLPGNFVQDVAYWNGMIWLATHDGLVYCSPEIFQTRELPRVPILVEEVMVNRQVMDKNVEVELKHDENDLAIHFLGMSMRKPRGDAFYRYRLNSGRDSIPWEYTNDRAVRYMNLAPGDYTFEVAAQNRNKEWSAEAATYSFQIRPHFSSTLWFQSLVALLAVGLVLGLTYYRVQRIRQKADQKRSLQEARLKTQEAEITALRNQMNPHFVFNALNSIQNFIFKNDIRQANFYLSKFSKLMRDGLQFSRKKMISLDEELTFLKAYLDLETMRFPGRFGYKLEVDDTLDLSRVQVPPFLFQPLLENAVKHAFKDIDYPGVLAVGFHKASQDHLEVRIQDNGPGFQWRATPRSDKPHRSMGLQIVQDRIALLNAEEGAESARFEMVNLSEQGGQGMLAQFLIPIKLESNG